MNIIQVRKVKKILEYYADQVNYTVTFKKAMEGQHQSLLMERPDILNDKGVKAREALSFFFVEGEGTNETTKV